MTVLGVFTGVFMQALAAAAVPDLAGPDPAIDCDRLAAHPEDPDRAAPGVLEADIALDAAVLACAAAVDADPDEPRLRYQYARVLDFADRRDEAREHWSAAKRSSYPHALMMDGYLTLMGEPGHPGGACEGGTMMRQAALEGHFTALVGFPHYALVGHFRDCGDTLAVDPEELAALLEAAASQADGFYEQILVEHLYARIEDLRP